MKPVYVIGHKNPDTDSICSAICYANLKRILTGREHTPCRAGEINTETSYVLEHFHVPVPRLLTSLHPRLSDVQYRNVAGINAQMSLRRAWQYMNEHSIQTIPVVDENNYLLGLLTLSDIARFYMEDQDANALAEARTSYRNLVDVLSGDLVVGDLTDHVTEGQVIVAAANPDVMEDYIHEHDLVILGNRYESQLCSIEMKAGCIIIGLGSKVSRTIQNWRAKAAAPSSLRRWILTPVPRSSTRRYRSAMSCAPTTLSRFCITIWLPMSRQPLPKSVSATIRFWMKAASTWA